ncbi:hypothetical protein [Psychrobacter sp.]|uniref:hypothetical protein n=1 Tax=Psychrobacter sp. TaxID=56811 RepID=UPI003F981EAC
MKFLSVLPLALAAAVAMPQANAADIKQSNIDACIAGAVENQIANESDATELCNCTVDVRSEMTIGQMWEIESYAQNQEDPSNLPYVQAMQQDLQQCTEGLDLQQPQQPS